MFLSDRFIKGTCPKCKAEDQYGDACEVCGTTYNATELLNPRSTLSGATPVEKSSDHYFFKLPNFGEYLQKWTRDEGRLPVSIANKLDEWFEAGLADWDISRDAPYFGFEIPDAPNKYFMCGSMRQLAICRALKTTSKPSAQSSTLMITGKRQPKRSLSLHWQRHCLLPCAVLAGNA